MLNEFVPGRMVSWLSLLSLALLAGCGGASDDYKGPRGEVTGTVTYKGDPVPEGSIIMFQTKEGPTYMAGGTIKADGTYFLMYNGKRELPAVTYMVQISPPPENTPSVLPTDPDYDPVAATKAAAEAAKAEPPFPRKYMSYGTLEETVEAGKNVKDFELE